MGEGVGESGVVMGVRRTEAERRCDRLRFKNQLNGARCAPHFRVHLSHITNTTVHALCPSLFPSCAPFFPRWPYVSLLRECATVACGSIA